MVYSLLLHLNGINGSTETTDYSLYNHPVTFIYDARLSTSEKVFGTSSLFVDGSGDCLSIPSHDAFDLQGEDFTIDLRVRFTDLTNHYHVFVSKWGYLNKHSWQFGYENSGELYFSYSTDGINTISLRVLGVPASINEWYHAAVVRSGPNLYFFVNGILLEAPKNIGTDVIYTTNESVNIGSYQDGEGPFPEYFEGYADEVRILKGEAAWTSSFTPPTSEYTGPEVEPTVTMSRVSAGQAIGDSLLGGDSGINNGNVANGYETYPEDIYIRHTNTHEITDCKFYLDAYSGEYNGKKTAALDLTELIEWGDSDASKGFLIDTNHDGTFDYNLRTGQMDSSVNGVALNDVDAGGSNPDDIGPDGEGHIKVKIAVPSSVTSSGVRQFDFLMSYSYTS